MKKTIILILIFSTILITQALADYVEIGSSGNVLLNRPFCGS